MIEVAKEHAATLCTERGVKVSADDILSAYYYYEGSPLFVTMKGKVKGINVTVELTPKKAEAERGAT